jgi:hypothetical protein
VLYHTVSDCTVTVPLKKVISLSQCFITLCLWLYCDSITKKMVILSQCFVILYLSVLWQYHYEEWYVYHSDLSWYVSDCTVSVSLRRVIRLSQWFIMVRLWLYCISITKMSDTSITVIYHGLIQYSQRRTMINHCDRRITLLSDTDTVQSET